MTVLVENYFPTERGNPWLQVPFGSDKDRISHESCVFEMGRILRLEDTVEVHVTHVMSAHFMKVGIRVVPQKLQAFVPSLGAKAFLFACSQGLRARPRRSKADSRATTVWHADLVIYKQEKEKLT